MRGEGLTSGISRSHEEVFLYEAGWTITSKPRTGPKTSRDSKCASVIRSARDTDPSMCKGVTPAVPDAPAADVGDEKTPAADADCEKKRVTKLPNLDAGPLLASERTEVTIIAVGAVSKAPNCIGGISCNDWIQGGRQALNYLSDFLQLLS